MDGFSLGLDDLTPVGADLQRPECVLALATGDLYVSDARGGVTQIHPDGRHTLYAGNLPDGATLAANGFALLPDGTFLVAPLAGGGVFRFGRDGQVAPFLLEADGVPLRCPNFVLLDDAGRIWICCLTNQDRRTLTRYHRDLRDGFIVLIDERGARIVAAGIGFPNEVRVDPTGRWLYANETLGARLLRYPIQSSGTLGAPETVVAFDETNMFDGFAMDSQGGAWITTLVSNRLWYVTRDGDARLLIEDSHPEQVATLARMQVTSGVERSVLYEDRGLTLRNISSVAFGGTDLRTAYLGSLMGSTLLSFRIPIPGMRPAHWDFGPFA